MRISLIHLLFLLPLFVTTGCSQPAQTENAISPKDDTIVMVTVDPTIDTMFYELNSYYNGTYLDILNKLKIKRGELKTRLIACRGDSAKEAAVLYDANRELVKHTVNGIFHHWYGTPWDFDGYTDIPNQGKIACGYFLSTTLKHAGFNVDRYKLAQQNPTNEMLSISSGSEIISLQQTRADSVLKYFYDHPFQPGLYAVGLDFHVGYLLYRGDQLFFIHSNYIDAEGVKIEKALTSQAFNASANFRIAPITTNKNLMKKWLMGEQIQIVKK